MRESETTTISQIGTVVQRSRYFFAATHVRPDGDAIGSLLAITTMLKKLGKVVHPYCQDPVPEDYRFLPDVTEIRQKVEKDINYEVAFLVDCGELDRVGELAEAVKAIPIIINIDHHINSAPFGTIHWVDPEASSTCELLYKLSKGLGINLDEKLATQLYTGLLTDTGSFRFSNTTGSAFRMAASLVEAGAKPVEIAEYLYESYSPQRLHLLARVLASVRYRLNARLAFAELTLDMIRETASNPADSEGFVNLLRSVRSVQVAALFRQGEDGLVHVSLRSKGSVDVASFARLHGGGGHRNAAAFRLRDSWHEAKERIIKELEEFLR